MYTWYRQTALLALHRFGRQFVRILTYNWSVSWIWAEHWAEILDDLSIRTRLPCDAVFHQQR